MVEIVATVMRWAFGQRRYRFAPYRVMVPNVLKDNVGYRTLNSEERELLMDFKRRHIITCMPTRARKASPVALEDERCAVLGDLFSCARVAFVLQHALDLDGLMPRLQTVAEMRQALPQECHPELSRDEMQYRLAQVHTAQADPRGSDVRFEQARYRTCEPGREGR